MSLTAYNPAFFLLVCSAFVCFQVKAVETDDCLNMHVIQSVPLAYMDEEGELAGIHVEMLDALQAHSGLCINKLLMPVSRIVKSLALGQHDGGLLLRSAKRDHLVELVLHTGDIDTVVIPRKGVTVKSYQDIRNLVIGKIGGMPLRNDFDSDNDLTLVQLNRYGQAAQMLERGRVDVLAGSSGPLYHHLSEINNIDKKIDMSSKFVLGTQQQWLQLSKQSAHLDKLPQLKMAAQKMIENGDLVRIKRKYYGSLYREWLEQQNGQSADTSNNSHLY